MIASFSASDLGISSVGLISTLLLGPLGCCIVHRLVQSISKPSTLPPPNTQSTIPTPPRLSIRHINPLQRTPLPSTRRLTPRTRTTRTQPARPIHTCRVTALLQPWCRAPTRNSKPVTETELWRLTGSAVLVGVAEVVCT